MIVELRPRLQVIIPRQIADDMELRTGDKFEVVAEDGVIKFIPVVVYQKAEAERLERLAGEARSAQRPGQAFSHTPAPTAEPATAAEPASEPHLES